MFYELNESFSGDFIEGSVGLIGSYSNNFMKDNGRGGFKETHHVCYQESFKADIGGFRV